VRPGPCALKLDRSVPVGPPLPTRCMKQCVSVYTNCTPAARARGARGAARRQRDAARNDIRADHGFDAHGPIRRAVVRRDCDEHVQPRAWRGAGLAKTALQLAAGLRVSWCERVGEMGRLSWVWAWQGASAMATASVLRVVLGRASCSSCRRLHCSYTAAHEQEAL
jgi:hypothetical protein